MRALLYAAALVLVMIMVAPMLSAWRRGVAPARRTRRDELVKDPVCQTYVVLSRAVTTEVDGAATYFCSEECATRFARGERRR
jgi:YHS domain-containing protein